MRAVLVVLLLAVASAATAAPVPKSGPKPPPRVYAGAPPAIPHAVWDEGRQNCLDCHDVPPAMEGAISAPHARRLRCMQCHVEGSRPQKPFRPNHFVGMQSTGRLARASAFAPPPMPHRAFMRERCLACHGPDGYPAIRSPHPQRPRCMQCHVEQKPGARLFRTNRLTR